MCRAPHLRPPRVCVHSTARPDFQILPQSLFLSALPGAAPWDEVRSTHFLWGLLLCGQGKGPASPRARPAPGHRGNLLFSVALLSLGSSSRTNCPSSLSLSNHLVGKRGAVSSSHGGGRQPTLTQFCILTREAGTLNSGKGKWFH